MKSIKEIARVLGVKDVDKMSQAEYRDAAINAVKQLGIDVGIPQNLKGIVKEEDIEFLADCAFKDACAPGNPRDCTKEEIVELYKSLI